MFATSTARILDAVGDLLGRTLGPEDVEPFNWALARWGAPCSARSYLRTVDWLFGYTRRVAAWWADGFDLLADADAARAAVDARRLTLRSTP
jgi:amidase